jgi:hypothetical protein
LQTAPAAAARTRAAIRSLCAERARPFDGGDKPRCRRNMDAVRTDESLDESSAACVIAGSTDGGFELRRVFLHCVRDIETPPLT